MGGPLRSVVQFLRRLFADVVRFTVAERDGDLTEGAVTLHLVEHRFQTTHQLWLVHVHLSTNKLSLRLAPKGNEKIEENLTIGPEISG